MNAADLFSANQQKQILDAIGEAEKNTSGEIRVHIESDFKGEVLDRAATLFARLGMHKTALRNGVLFYLSVSRQKFAVIGDAGINKLVPENFWDNIKSTMESYFRKSEFTEGLATGIRMAGHELEKNFPCKPDDVNELPNDISFGKE